jgi:hypothetical protein
MNSIGAEVIGDILQHWVEAGDIAAEEANAAFRESASRMTSYINAALK